MQRVSLASQRMANIARNEEVEVNYGAVGKDMESLLANLQSDLAQLKSIHDERI